MAQFPPAYFNGENDPNRLEQVSERPVAAMLSTDSNGNTVLVGADGQEISIGGLGDVIKTVGTGGDYATLQDAFDYLITVDTTTAVDTNVTCGVTQNSKVVTFASTALSADGTYFSISSSTARKWYKIAWIDSLGGSLELVSPYQETTNASVAASTVTVTPVKLLMIETPANSAAYINATGATGGGQLDFFAVDIDFNGFSLPNAIEFSAKSGLLQVRNLKALDKNNSMLRLAAGTDTKNVIDIEIFQSERESQAGIDFIFPASTTATKLSSVYVKNCVLTGMYDIVLSAAMGNTHIVGSHVESFPFVMTAIGSNRPIGRVFGASGAGLTIETSVLKTEVGNGVDGTATTAGLLELVDSSHGGTLGLSGCVARITNTKCIANKSTGTTELDNFYAVRSGVNDSDIYLDGVTFDITGSPTIGATWRMFTHTGVSGTKSRLHIRNCKLLDLPSTMTQLEVVELVGDRGTKALTASTSNAFVVAELSALRGSVFTATLGENITAIPLVTDAPDGTDVTFVFTQDGTGGRAVGWNVGYKFQADWTNANNTPGKISSVTFRKTGAYWIQTSGQNAWV